MTTAEPTPLTPALHCQEELWFEVFLFSDLLEFLALWLSLILPAGRVNVLSLDAEVKDPHNSLHYCVGCWLVLCCVPIKVGNWVWKGRPTSHICGHPFPGSTQPLWKQMSSPAANGHRDIHSCQSRGTKCWHPDLKGRRGEADLLQEVPVRGRGRGEAVVPGGGGGESRIASRHREKPNSSSALKLSATHTVDITWIFLTPCSTIPHLHAESWLLPTGM